MGAAYDCCLNIPARTMFYAKSKKWIISLLDVDVMEYCICEHRRLSYAPKSCKWGVRVTDCKLSESHCVSVSKIRKKSASFGKKKDLMNWNTTQSSCEWCNGTAITTTITAATISLFLF